MTIGIKLEGWERKLQLPEIEASDSDSDGHDTAISSDMQVDDLSTHRAEATSRANAQAFNLSDKLRAREHAVVLPNQQEAMKHSVAALMATYENMQANSPALGALYLLALFPYPVTSGTLLTTLAGLALPADKQLLQWNRTKGLHQRLRPLLVNGKPNAERLDNALQELAAAGLLRIEQETMSIFSSVAAYFADILRYHLFDEWRLQQQQLAYYYDDLLLQAEDVEQHFWLHCKKLLHSLATTHKQQAMEEVYRPHIAPFLASPVSSAGLELRLHLLSGFFQQIWHKPDFCLQPETRGYALAETGQALYQLGEQEGTALALLNEAYSLMVEAHQWSIASDLADLLGRHAAKQQDIVQSMQLLRQSITYTEQGQQQEPLVLLRRLRSLFQLCKHHGARAEAQLIADKAQPLLQQLKQQQLQQKSQQQPGSTELALA